ncbi:hypothetical protein ACQYRI_10830 [Salmonella enterica]
MATVAPSTFCPAPVQPMPAIRGSASAMVFPVCLLLADITGPSFCLSSLLRENSTPSSLTRLNVSADNAKSQCPALFRATEISCGSSLHVQMLRLVIVADFC